MTLEVLFCLPLMPLVWLLVGWACRFVKEGQR